MPCCHVFILSSIYNISVCGLAFETLDPRLRCKKWELLKVVSAWMWITSRLINSMSNQTCTYHIIQKTITAPNNQNDSLPMSKIENWKCTITTWP